MKSRVALAAIVVVCFAGARPLPAATATTTFTITATVGANCTITANTIDFGSYDPIRANRSSALTGTGTVSIACTKGSAPIIGLNAGIHAGAVSGVTRAMSNGTDMLGYELKQPAAAPGNGGIWTDVGGANPLNPGVSPGKAARSFTIAGSIPAAQDVAVGNYTDTVTATVNF
jgi:spore coat protein U-like protein